MDEFKKRYNSLNSSQRKAADLIEGPALVLAGPGTGKTELLSVRVANILSKTDASAENILCLTYTDSGVNAIRERLIGIIGRDAYRVAIHTFHSFGSEIIAQNSDFFYHGAEFKNADELKKNEIIIQILSSLNSRDILASKQNGRFTYQSAIVSAISHIKNSGLTGSELLGILDQNDLMIERVNQTFQNIFGARISPKIIEPLNRILPAIRDIKDQPSLPLVSPLSRIFADSLENVLNEAALISKTTPITVWKNTWFEHDNEGRLVLKSAKRQQKLRSLANVYELYIKTMSDNELYDFDDMILEVVHAMEVQNDLRYNLQEKYQYIMVDEFQDTNLAQMRILRNLTNNPAQNDTPNIMAVGDDDQAIYSFQGAEVSNILSFMDLYPRAELITLNDNYRSTAEILAGAHDIITQGKDRLENVFENVSKKLSANAKHNNSQTQIYKASDSASEYSWIASHIRQQIDDGEEPSEIAILVRHHREVEPLLAYLTKEHIPISYTHQDDVLENEVVLTIEKLARLLLNLSDGKLNQANAILPEILTHPMWNITAEKLWQLSLQSYKNHNLWLENMANDTELQPIYSWLIETAVKIKDTPLEQAIDLITGKQSSDEFTSPVYQYFFSDTVLEQNPEQYLAYLDALSTIRTHLRNYSDRLDPNLSAFIEFVDSNRSNNIKLSSHRQSISSRQAVNVMTAHKAKGLEFDTVYVINAIDSIWGRTVRSRPQLITFPENLTIAPSGESDDEKLRLFYVAITRARKKLFISYAEQGDNNKKNLEVSFLNGSSWPEKPIPKITDKEQLVQTAEIHWYQPLIKPGSHDLKQLLAPTLENYRLSPTHLNAFIDLVYSGPDKFLLDKLLHFPSAKTPESAYGTAIHSTLQQAHIYIAEHGKQPIEDIIGSFETNLKAQYLNKADFKTYLDKGIEALRAFLDEKYNSFSPSQKVELDFALQDVVLDEAHLTGKLDLVDIDTKAKTIQITDYKTGRPSVKWASNDVKLHKYRQQLLFYKLLVENSRDYHTLNVESCTMQFVEPDVNGRILGLGINFEQNEMQHLSLLIESVWKHIINLDFPDTSQYNQDTKGIKQFEQDLIEGKI